MAAALSVAGCADGIASPFSREPVSVAPSNTSPPGVTFRMQGLPPELVAGFGASSTLEAFDADWSPLEVLPATWSSSDPLVLDFTAPLARATYVRAWKAGRADVVVTSPLLGATARTTVAVHARPEELTHPDSAPVLIQNFRAGEIAGREWPTFVPLATLYARGGRPLVLLEMQLLVPGLPPMMPCAINRELPRSGLPRELVAELYGDWELEHSALGTRDANAEATLRIIVRDDSAKTWWVEAKGPVEAIGPPTSYSPSHGGTWSCGHHLTPLATQAGAP